MDPELLKILNNLKIAEAELAEASEELKDAIQQFNDYCRKIIKN